MGSKLPDAQRINLLTSVFFYTDMVEAEERKIKERDQEIKAQEEHDIKVGKIKHKKHDHHHHHHHEGQK